jgi:hypothetical protein
MQSARRFSNKIILAHEHALRDGKIDVADLLMEALMIDLSAIGGDKPEYITAMDTIERNFECHEAARNRY